jgi:hypothetical protein
VTATTCTFYLTCTELRLFTRVVQSFVHGSISWKLDKDARHAINHWTALCTHRITGKSVHEESTKPVVKMVAWILYWQNRKVGRVAQRSHTFWPRQEMLRRVAPTWSTRHVYLVDAPHLPGRRATCTWPTHRTQGPKPEVNLTARAAGDRTVKKYKCWLLATVL